MYEKTATFLQLLDSVLESSDDDESLFFNSSSSDDENEIVMTAAVCKCRDKNNIPRLEQYVEKIISNYSAQEFKMHFRYVFKYCIL